MKKKKHCPACGSTKINVNEKGEISCRNCPYTNSKFKQVKLSTYEKGISDSDRN